MTTTTSYRCEALTTAGRRCKCQEELCLPIASGKEYLTCRQHARAAAIFRPAVKVSACPPPVEW